MCSKRWRTKRSRRRAELWGLCVSVCLILLLIPKPALGLDKLEDLQQHFDKETHAGSKVKALDKLTEAQFEQSRKATAAGDFNSAGLILEKYRDNVRACFDLLRKQEPDADRHPSGYRQLELQTRRGIREVEDTMLTAPPELRPPLELVHKDILQIDDDLIRLLFPRRTPEPEKVPPVPPEAKP
jgi:hypothetical protein